jgi:hypothetical protein
MMMMFLWWIIYEQICLNSKMSFEKTEKEEEKNLKWTRLNSTKWIICCF